jgi:hypothetical protein
MRKALTRRGVVRQGVLIRGVLGAAACAVTALLYLPALDYPFVLDDRTAILLNPSLVALSDWRGILTYDRWHPLVNASFAFDQALSGISPFGFRITTGILHLVVVALVFALGTRGPDDEEVGRAWAGFAAAGAFGVNPLTMRSVAYVAARADLLFAAGVLLAAMLAWGAARARSVPRMVLATAVAALAAAATPWGTAPHGPPRLYLTTALALVIGARATHTLFARSRAARIGAALIVGTLASLTPLSLSHWADPVALWRATAGRTPGAWDAHLGYADALREASRCAQAIPEYETTLRLRPEQADARRGLAWCAGAR